jgi:hypothetical protein
MVAYYYYRMAEDYTVVEFAAEELVDTPAHCHNWDEVVPLC